MAAFPRLTSSTSSPTLMAPPALHDHVHLLAAVVGVDGLLAARLALDPGDGQVLGSELAGSQKQVRDLTAAMVLRALIQSLNVHR